MPPTFPIFLGAMLYSLLCVVTSIVFVPLLFIKRSKIRAKKVLYTVIISFPCLIITGTLCSIVFVFPAFLFFWLINNNYVTGTPQIIISFAGLLTFVSSVAISALYLWYIASNIFYNRVDKKPMTDFINRKLVLKFLRPSLRERLL